MAKRSSRKSNEDEEPTYKISYVLDAIHSSGADADPNSVKRVSRNLLGFDTKRGAVHHRWTSKEIDALVTVFRLNRVGGISWPKIIEAFQGHSTLDIESAVALVEAQLAETLATVHEIEAKARALDEIRLDLINVAA